VNGLVIDWGQVAEGGVPPGRVAPGFDHSKIAWASSARVAQSAPVEELDLHRAEERRAFRSNWPIPPGEAIAWRTTVAHHLTESRTQCAALSKLVVIKGRAPPGLRRVSRCAAGRAAASP
jgi:hypothetical protein